jgi:hypothetical protein
LIINAIKNEKAHHNVPVRSLGVAIFGQKVGIGTTTPAFKLDVKEGSINTDSLYRITGNAVLSIKGSGNTFAGVNSGFSNSTGVNNTAIGFQSLHLNTTGESNTASGFKSLFSNPAGKDSAW